jgi:hypothetical protein
MWSITHYNVGEYLTHRPWAVRFKLILASLIQLFQKKKLRQKAKDLQPHEYCKDEYDRDFSAVVFRKLTKPLETHLLYLWKKYVEEDFSFLASPVWIGLFSSISSNTLIFDKLSRYSSSVESTDTSVLAEELRLQAWDNLAKDPEF